MKSITEIYPDDSYYNYDPLLESIAEIVLKVDDNDYQGDSRLIFKRGDDEYGLLIFGWGSCSGCDALQGCVNAKDVEELRETLMKDIRWDSKKNLHDYIANKDWEVEYCYHDNETKHFIKQALELLKS